MTRDEAAKLREPFPPHLIGKLPKAGIELDFVGHAATTDRLLQVDPEWTWEPLGVDAQGSPAIVSGLGEPKEPIGLWIKLTVCGVTRPGFGSGKTAKEAISDAIRNAAMRFGVALDLWSKEDLHATGSAAVPTTTDSVEGSQVRQEAPAAESPFKAPTTKRGSKKASKDEVERLRHELIELVTQAGAVDSLQAVHAHADQGDAEWLKRQIERTAKHVETLEPVPFA